MKKKYTNYIMAILIFINLFTFFKLNSLENSLDYEKNQYRSEINELRNEINNIYSNVDSKLKKEASIIDKYNIEFGEKLNTDKMTVPITLSVTPKEYSADLKAFMFINNEKIPMDKNNVNEFTATYDAEVFNSAKIKVALDINGVEKIETLEEYSDMQFKYILSMHGGFNGSSKYNQNEYLLKGHINIYFVGQNDNKPVKLGIVNELNGKNASEREIDISNLNKDLVSSYEGEQPAIEEFNSDDTVSENYLMMPIDEGVVISPNNRITYYLLVTDKYGLTYKYIILSDKIDENGKIVNARPEWTNGNIVEIKDKNRKVLYKPDYNS